MKRAIPWMLAIVGIVWLTSSGYAWASDWPQWRGPNRDAKVTDFKAPAIWPKDLTQKWKVTVGDGVGTPALVGDKLYVFAREDGNEILRCLDANTGSELWQDKYESPSFPPNSFDSGYPGPRASPTVADGKVVVIGVNGTASCYDAASRSKLWRKEGNGVPKFHESSSPIVSDGLCIAQLGGDRGGGIFALDLNTGDEKWKWTGDGPGHASPILVNVGGTKAVVAVTATKLVAVNAADGSELWKIPCLQSRPDYQPISPIADGSTIIYAGPARGLTATSLEKTAEGLAAKERWKYSENSLMYNTPVIRNGWLFGLSANTELFCLNAATGEAAWTAGLPQPGAAPAADSPIAAGPVAQAGGRGPGGRGRGGMRGGGVSGYGSVVDAGNVLIALNPTGQLVVFEPNNTEFKPLASYKVAESDTYAYPVVTGNRIYIKDKNTLTLWTTE